MPDPVDIHPNAPAGGGGAGAFTSASPAGTNPALDKWNSPGTLGAKVAAPSEAGAAAQPTQGGTPSTPTPKTETDPEIEALDLADVAKKAAYELKKQHPSVTFTSGRRDKSEQASAMAGNVAQNRNWIKETYAVSTARSSCQKWVDDNPDKKTAPEIAQGLTGVLNGLTDAQLAALSKHLTGAAFDVQPVSADADKIKATIRSLSGLSLFLEKEGGLVRWHAQF